MCFHLSATEQIIPEIIISAKKERPYLLFQKMPGLVFSVIN